MLTDTLFVVGAHEHAISNAMLFVNAFSGAGAALAIFLLTQVVSKIVEVRRRSRRREELLRLILDEVSSNYGRLSEMITDPHFRPYWQLSTHSFYNVAQELSGIIGKKNELLSAIYVRYRAYDMLNRQLDLLHFREEGLKATIYLDATLPLAKIEHSKTYQLEESLKQELSVREEEQAENKGIYEKAITYDDLREQYKKALDEVEDYWVMLSDFGKRLYNTMLEQLECDASVFGVAHMKDKEGLKSADFFDTLHFRNLADGTYRFRIQLRIRIDSEPDFFVTIPITLWLSDRNVNVQVRNGEFFFSYPAGGAYDLSDISQALIKTINTGLRGNLKDIKPEKQDF